MGRKCKFEGCKTYGIYGLEKNKPIHCKKHKTVDEKDVLNKMCETCNKKQATYGTQKKKPKWCKDCKIPDAFDVKHSMCEDEKCQTRPTFGETKAVRCVLHKKEGDKAFGYKYCEVKNCKLIPSFSDSINNVALRCSKHKLINWVDVSHTSAICKFKDCTTQSVFGLPKGKAEYCSKHKSEEMIDLKHDKCLFEGCDIQATFGELDGKRLYCTKHKESHHISLKYMVNGELHTALYNVFCFVKSKDKKLKREFNLTMEFLLNLYEKQDNQCFYCKNTLNIKNCNQKNLDQLSIDRKDSKLGHVKDNCVLTCLFCNFSKSNSSVDTFKLFLKFIKNPKKEYTFEIEDNTIDWISPFISRIKLQNPDTDIDNKWFKTQFKKQNGKCFYTDIKMIITTKSRFLFKPSIERIECNKTYTKENCVLVCLSTNLGRNDFPLKNYLEYINKLRS